VILVGHSYGGMVITGAADRAADRVGHVVYLDAATPANGESLATHSKLFAEAQRKRIFTVDGVELIKHVSDGRLWDIDAGHNLMITEPRATADILLKVAAP
jgi:thioesterase domain-containing protein